MKILKIIILSLIITSGAFAQKSKRDQIKALKVSFITKELNFSEKEAQEFWPIYNAYDQSMHKYRYSSLRALRKKIRDNYEAITEEEAEQYLNQFLEIENKVHDERNILISKLRKILPAKKIIALKSAEDDFNRKILDQFRKGRKGMHDNK